MSEKSMAVTGDGETQAKVVESLVLRGDLSGLTPVQRARHYIQMCESLGLNPNAQPFAFLRLNGKEILYANKGATDQLAAIHRINREIIDGPKVIDLAGTKLVYAVCRASLPNGRFETATATVPLVDPMNVLMKAETKAKRRATMSILGLALLDEMELETIPANVQSPGGGVDLSRANDSAVDLVLVGAETPAQLGEFYERVADIELPGEAVVVWMRHRADLAPLASADREKAWQALCRRTEEVGKMKNAKVWLKKAIAEEDARRGNRGPSDPQAALETAGDTRAETPRSALDSVRESAAVRHTVRELADLWRSARADLGATKDGEAGWKIIADRALALSLVPAAVKAEVQRLDEADRGPKNDGPRGGAKPAAPANTDARGEGHDGGAAQGAQASADAWRESAEGIVAHVARISAARHLESSARQHLRDVPEVLRLHAVHVYAGRLQRLSHDGSSSLAWDECVHRAETWLREGPRVAVLPERVRPAARATLAAGGAR